jgi:outer membrane protein OmpA-like peptidoglycan-associated protein
MKTMQRVVSICMSAFMLYGCANKPIVEKYAKSTMSGNESTIVFYRDGGTETNIPSVWVEDRVVGSLLPNRYAQVVTCAGNRQVRVDDRYGVVDRGSEQLLNAPKGQVAYIKVMDTATAGHFALAQVDAQTAEADLTKLGAKSHIINRHYATCDTTYTDLDADTLFDFDKSTLTPAGIGVINGYAAKILAQQVPVTSIRVEGFTDRLGNPAYNERLSLARAKTVANQMRSQNVKVPIETIGMGERYPVTKNCVGSKATAQLLKCLAPDRRVRIASKVAVETTRVK